MNSMPAAIDKGPDDYWKSPRFVRRYTVNNINLLRENKPAALFNITCMMGFLQGIKYLCEKPQVILDAGCGHATRPLDIKAKLGCRVIGLDYSQPMLEEANRIMQMLPEERRIELVQGDVLNIEYPDNHFDVSMCYGLLMSVPNGAKAISELMRVSKYGVVAIEETEDAMYDEQRERLSKVRHETYPGRIYWHNYNRLFSLAGAQTINFTILPVDEGWSMGIPPAFGRYIAVKGQVI